MVLHPFRPPPLSPIHRDLLEQLALLGADRANKAYEKFSKTESRSYKDGSGDHCVYCGVRTDRLDIDHFHPKGRPKYECVRVETTATGADQRNAAVVPIALSADQRLVYEASRLQPPRSNTRAVDPDNLVPACSACNSPTRTRLFNDLPALIGKHNRFPVMWHASSSSVVPALPSPFAVTWKQLLSQFAFVDLHDPPIKQGRGRFSKVLGSVRATIVLPRAIYNAMRDGGATPAYQDETLSALTAIDLLGLNRKRLAEDRFRHRRMFRALLPSVKALAELAEGLSPEDFQFRLDALDHFRSVGVDPIQIGEALRDWPHKLALLDTLLSWADASDEFDVDGLMATYSSAPSPIG